MNVKTLEALLKARGWTYAELARRVGVSRQAVSLWFRGKQANPHGEHLVKLSRVLGVSVEEIVEPLPGFDPQTHAQLHASFLWDRLFPDLDDFAIALNTGDPRALARFVEVEGIYAAEQALGPSVWVRFPDYKRFIHPAPRRGLEILWARYKNRTAA